MKTKEKSSKGEIFEHLYRDAQALKEKRNLIQLEKQLKEEQEYSELTFQPKITSKLDRSLHDTNTSALY